MAIPAKIDPAAPPVTDPRCGIVKRLRELPREADDPRVFCFVSEAARDPRDGIQGSPYGCGAGYTRQAAASAASGEILERYAASWYQPDALVNAAYDELREEAVPPEAFALFSPSQYARFASATGPRLPYVPFTRETRTRWVHGWSLTRERPVLAPAPFVFFPYLYEPGEAYLTDSLSTGLACAPSRDEAVLKALCEVVERDALSIIWQNAIPPKRIALEGPLRRLVDERFACRGVRYHLLDATLDVSLPTVVAVLVDDCGGAAVGSATRPAAYDAASKALLEAAQCRVAWKRDLVRGAARRYAPDFSDVVTYADHARLYTLREMRPHLAFLWSSPLRVCLEELPSAAGGGTAAELGRAVALLAAAGLEPVAFDLTSDDVREEGFHVVRVVVPGMEGLNARHAAPFRGGRRLRKVPSRLDLRPHAHTEAELNTSPYPFP